MMNYLANICKLADNYEKLALGVALEEAPTAPNIPHPLSEKTLPAETPEESLRKRQEEMPDFEYIPGFDFFSQALDHLRNAKGYVEQMRPETYRTFVVRKLMMDAARQIEAGMKSVYKATPPEKLQANP